MEARGGPLGPPNGWTPHDPYPGHDPRPQGQPHGPVAESRIQPTQTAPTNLFAVLSLVAAIIGIVGILPGVGSIIAIIFAIIARNEMSKDPTQRGSELATWGLIVGIVGLVLWVLIALFFALVAMFFGSFGYWGPWWMDW